MSDNQDEQDNVNVVQFNLVLTKGANVDTLTAEGKKNHAALQDLWVRRDQIVAKMVKIYNDIDSFMNGDMDRCTFEAKISMLGKFLTQLEDNQRKIYNNPLSSEDDEEENEVIFKAYHNKVLRMATVVLDEFKEESKPNVSSVKVKLPEQKVPEFNGDLLSWKRFKETFESLIHSNPQIPNVQKFHYLLSALKNGTDSTIKEIPLSSDNYEIAWNVLQDRYDNQNALIEAHLEKLFSLKTVAKDNMVELRGLVDVVQSNVRALSALKVPVEHWDAVLIYIMKLKLDMESQKQWQLQLQPKEVPSYEKMIAFLNNRCRMLESVQRQKSSKEDSKAAAFKGNQKAKSFATEAKQVECQLCKESHNLYHCPTFLQMTPKDRKEKVRSLRACYKCLGPHTRDCTTKKSCRICGNSSHNTLLHMDYKSFNTEESNKDADKKEDSKTEKKPVNLNASIVVHSTETQQKAIQIVMGTAIVLVADSNGNWQEARALLDSASNSCFMTDSFAQKLSLQKKKISIPVTGIEEIQTHIKWKTFATFKSRVSDYQDTTEFLVVSRIANEVPSTEIDISEWNIPQNLQLADPTFFKSRRVDLLIGTQHFYDVLRTGRFVLGADKPSMFDSKLGWIIAGGINSTKQEVNRSYFMESCIEKCVTKEWLEDKQLSQEDIKCEAHFQQTCHRDSNGWYVVSLPMKADSRLGESYTTALRCLQRLQKQFEVNPELERLYRAFMYEYQKLGHMEEVPKEELDAPDTYYIPHHPVIKLSSSTTQLRVVFNASSKTTNHRSLNNVLMTGPNIQNDLRTLLINFMVHNYVFVADIEKMFRQIGMNRSCWDLLRILWIVDQKVVVMRLKTVTYGTVCAPFQAVRVLKQAAEDHHTKYPLGSQAVKRDYYMDNQMSGADDLNQLKQIQRETIQLMSEAGMKLRKFAANHSSLLEDIAPEDIEPMVTITNEESGISTLGLMWNPGKDHFIFKVPALQEDIVWTKRSILSELHKLFDPLGWVGPITIVGNLIMQKIWMDKVDWDTPCSSLIQSQWKEFYSQWPLLQDFKKNRLVVPFKYQIELQGFADASLKGYGAVIYIKCRSSDGKVAVNLLCSQSRVAPQVNKKRKKPVTLPKLELNAALLLARLANKVVSTLQVQCHMVYLWSDSTIALSWIKDNADKFIPYVARRVEEIQQLTKSMKWKHVSTKENPADIISRGMMPEQLVKSELWWKGPAFLHKDEFQIPDDTIQPDIEVPECYLTQPNITNQSAQILDIRRFSNYNKMVRTVAWMLRFIHKCRHNTAINGPLSYEEVKQAERRLVIQVQQESYPEEWKSKSNNKPIDSKSQLLALNPTFKNDVIVVGGRLRNSLLSDSQKYPMILPPDHRFTKLLIEETHKRTLHGGPQLVLSTIRHKFWIVKGKQQVKKIVKQCMRCAKVKPRYIDQIMGDLPADRITPSRPFSVTGIDYCGYFHVQMKTTRSMTLTKVWVCVFVCYATKAVHLEPVMDLTTDAFRSCLVRFRARRGRCIILNSDNQTTFHGAKNQFDKEIHQFLTNPAINNEIKDLCTTDGLEWRFIPAKCPHVGGLWESCVKSFKHHFKRIVGESNLTMESFFTIVYDIESCLNSRPLMALSEDTDDYTALTPGHFLIGDALNSPVEPDVTNTPYNRLNQYKRRLKMQQLFWKAWSRDYLNTLQQRNKWRIEKKQLNIGDFVLLVEDNIPSTKWLMARVTETIEGPDGKIRMVVVKTKNRIIKRSVQRVCPLPTSDVE